MSWLYFTLLAYFVNAVAFIVDKYLLSSHIPKPFAYAFWVAILSGIAVVLIPFGVTILGLSYILTALVSGGAFFIGLIFLYKAIKESDISVASTMCGVVTAISTYILAVLFLNEPTDVFNFASITMLIIGTIFVGKTDKNIWRLAIWSGIFFGTSFALLKLSFDASDFVNGIFWTRMGFVGSALLSLFSANIRSEVLWSVRTPRPRQKRLFIGNKILAATGFLLLYYAIRLGEVSVVNSLLGFQFLFVFVLAVLLRSKIIRIEENISRKHVVLKLVGIGFIIAGFLTVLVR